MSTKLNEPMYISKKKQAILDAFETEKEKQDYLAELRRNDIECAKKWQKANPEKVKELTKKYYKENTEKAKEETRK